jgi:hypothetical protein
VRVDRYDQSILKKQDFNGDRNRILSKGNLGEFSSQEWNNNVHYRLQSTTWALNYLCYRLNIIKYKLLKVQYIEPSFHPFLQIRSRATLCKSKKGVCCILYCVSECDVNCKAMSQASASASIYMRNICIRENNKLADNLMTWSLESNRREEEPYFFLAWPTKKLISREKASLTWAHKFLKPKSKF